MEPRPAHGGGFDSVDPVIPEPDRDTQFIARFISTRRPLLACDDQLAASESNIQWFEPNGEPDQPLSEIEGYL